MITTRLAAWLRPFVAWFARVASGNLPPPGWAFGAPALAERAGVMGWGNRFPRSIPEAFSLIDGDPAEQLGLHSQALVSLASLLGSPPPSPDGGVEPIG